MNSTRSATRLALALVALVGVACAHRDIIPQTTVEDTETNRQVLKVIEEYKLRLLEKNVEGLLVLASPKYFEDAGTPRADDDYGFDGLRDILTTRLGRIRSLRYDIRYKNVKITGEKAEVEVELNGAFDITSETGERYRRINDFHRFVLERTPDDRWKFLSGM